MRVKAGKLLAIAIALLCAVAAALPVAAQQQPANQAAPAEPAPPPGPTPAQILERFNNALRELREQETQLNNERLQRFTRERQAAEQRTAAELRRRDAAEARERQLNARFEANEQAIVDSTLRLRQNEGNLGELFGVTRQVAGDVAGDLSGSMLSALEPPVADGEEGRTDFMLRLAAARALPSYDELERMWYELQREMINTGKVQKGQALVAPREDPAGERVPTEVVTIGPFVAVTGGEYLGYLPSGPTLAYLTQTMPPNLRALAQNLEAAPPGGYVDTAVDPARGALLSLYLARPGILARIESGEEVGALIIIVGTIGLLCALFQYGYLIVISGKIRSQLRNMREPRKNNALGRIVLAVRGRQDLARDPELVQLLISDAVLREVPALERFQAFLRLVIAAGPLLGLVGTVIGMIITFKAITAAGSGDPTLMARGIGQAMIATVLGLGVAIPLLFINAGLSARSRRISQTLDEQGFQLLADVTGGQDLKSPARA
jgi:biopolymer transport protein ExbB